MNSKGSQLAKVNRFRKIAFWEGVSYVVLLGIAMPLKYWADMPEAVRYVGWAHGLLFILYALSLLETMIACRWSLLRGGLFFLASLLPIAPFLVERSLKDETVSA